MTIKRVAGALILILTLIGLLYMISEGDILIMMKSIILSLVICSFVLLGMYLMK